MSFISEYNVIKKKEEENINPINEGRIDNSLFRLRYTINSSRFKKKKISVSALYNKNSHHHHQRFEKKKKTKFKGMRRCLLLLLLHRLYKKKRRSQRGSFTSFRMFSPTR